jgi:hypothetical protein
MYPIESRLDLPQAPPVAIRCEPDYYGASHLIAESLGLAEPPISTSTWVHGCEIIPVPRPVFSPHFNTPNQTHLVGNLATQRWWRDNGFSKAVAVGCPFLYTQPSGRERMPNSVLAMPNHGLPNCKHDLEHTKIWLNAVTELRRTHASVVVCLHADDIAELSPVVESLGLSWIVGARVQTLSLPRMRAIFESFEYMVTDVQGSHLAYAAWCGCKVVMLSPLYERKWERFEEHPHMKRNPQMLMNLVFHQPENVRERLPFFFVDDLSQAQCHGEWAAGILGMESKRTPRILARLLGWQADDPAFAGLAYGDVAGWLGAANPHRQVEWLGSQVERWKGEHAKMKAEHKVRGDLLRKAEKHLQSQRPFLESLSSRLARRLYSIEKRVRRFLVSVNSRSVG